MKPIIYILLLILFGCGQTSNLDKTNPLVDSISSEIKLPISSSDSIIVRNETIDLDSAQSLEILKRFAINYSPSNQPNSGVAILPESSDSVLKAINIVKNSNPKEFEKYLSLIFVKLYSAHLGCCHQSYEVRLQPARGLIDKDRDPLVYQFNILAKNYPKDKPIAFISSSIGYAYVKSNPYLLEFEPINIHMEKIEQIHKNVEDGIYWK